MSSAAFTLMEIRGVTSILTNLGTLTARPFAFVVLLAYALVWAAVDPASLDWHGLATLATWAMTLLIQRAEHRDTQAIHAKLDELLRSIGEADTEIAKIDDKEPEEIESAREQKQALD